MARIRTIKPEFWDDLKLSKVVRDVRLLYIGMWNFADDLGVIIGDHVWLKSKIFPFDAIQLQQFDKWIEMLVKSGFISPLSHNGEGFYYLPNLTRHQVINKPNYEKVNIRKTDLEALITSRNDPGTIRERSRPIEEGNGKEGKPPLSPTGEGRGDTAFIRPTAERVDDYCRERGNGITGAEFVDFYESKGWMVGKNRMKDWRAAVRTWENKRRGEPDRMQRQDAAPTPINPMNYAD